MATVYLAQDLKHDRKVAVKVLKPELAALFGTLYGGADYTLAHTSADPRERLTLNVKTAAGLDVTALLGRLEAETAYAGAR